MKVSIKWLKDYIDFEETAQKLADKLTMQGVPVENVVDLGASLDKVVTGKIEKLEKHTNSDHLQICTMNVGDVKDLIIVTGAQNVAEGQIVPVALIGAHLPNGLKIAKGKLRGVTSNGMLCSASELKLDLDVLEDNQKDGIYIFPEDTPIGIPVKDIFGINDVVLEFELTANRGDCFSVLGLAREIFAFGDGTIKFPCLEYKKEGVFNEDFKIEIENEDLCRRFSARVLTDVKVGPSPKWIVERLEAAGIRSINNLVDVTNFVMLEMGNPMHAYDYDKLEGNCLVARLSKAGEEIHTLDDNKKIADDTMLVIADGKNVSGLAGIMGGYATQIDENTKTVILECADFYGPSIRRTSRKFGLHTDASSRFERGVDRDNTVNALDRACNLLVDMGACKVADVLYDNYPVKKEIKNVEFSIEKINKHLGLNLSAEKIICLLSSVGFIITKITEDEYNAKVPSWRNDVTLGEDLAEEVARLFGFDNIEATLPSGSAMEGTQSKMQNLVDNIKEILVGEGLCETISFALTNNDNFDKLNLKAEDNLRFAIPIMNPLSDEYPLVRTTLISSIMDNVERNLARKNEDFGIFEIGFVFTPKELPLTELPKESLKLCGAITGKRYDTSWNHIREAVDFFDVKGIMENLLEKLHITRFTEERSTLDYIHSGVSCDFKKGKDTIASFGKLHPKVKENYGLNKDIFLFEIDLETLIKYLPKELKNKSLPKYPASTRDLAMLLDIEVPVADIQKAITKTAGNILREIVLFDLYTGKQIEEGKKSLAFSLVFQSDTKTLTDEEIDGIMDKVINKLEADFNAVLRK